MTKKKARARAARELRGATGLPFVLALGLAKVLERRGVSDAMLWALERGVEARETGGSDARFLAVEFAGPRGRFVAGG